MLLPKRRPGNPRRGMLLCTSASTDGLRQKYLVLRRREPGARHQLFCCCLWWTNCCGCCQHLHTGRLGSSQSPDLELGGTNYTHPAVFADTCHHLHACWRPLDPRAPKSRRWAWVVVLAFTKLPPLEPVRAQPSPAKPKGSESCSRSRGLGSRSRAASEGQRDQS